MQNSLEHVPEGFILAWAVIQNRFPKKLPKVRFPWDIYNCDWESREVVIYIPDEFHLDTIQGIMKTVLEGQSDVKADAAFITLHYTNDKGSLQLRINQNMDRKTAIFHNGEVLEYVGDQEEFDKAYYEKFGERVL